MPTAVSVVATPAPFVRAVGPVNVAEYEAYARKHLPKQVYDYYKSGAHDEYTLAENVNAYSRIVLRPRVLVDVKTIDCSTTILGQRISSPICFAPTAMQRMAHPEGEHAVARAAASLNTVMCLSSLSTTNLTAMHAANLNGLYWFQLYIYRDRSVTLTLIRAAEAAGYKALVLTVDTPFFGVREADVRNGFAMPAHLQLANFTEEKHTSGEMTAKASQGSGLAKYAASLFDPSVTWKDIDWLKQHTKLPIVLKGIITREDALLAVDSGCAAILVSNHGARQLDTVSSTIEALPEVVEAVAGRVEVYVDGGVRRGTDVLKALAYGARAVFVGRPALWGLTYGGEQGVRDVHNLLSKELQLAMGLLGVTSVNQIGRQHVTTKEAMRARL